MNTIWKYPLEMVPEQVVRLPVFARMLAVQVQRQGQREVPTIWAMVSPELAKDGANMVDVAIYLVGTGNPVPDNAFYLGTVQLADGHLVLHVFHGLFKTP